MSNLDNSFYHHQLPRLKRRRIMENSKDTTGGDLQRLPRDAIPIGDVYVNQYKAAAKSLADNKYLASLSTNLRSMQATFKCRQQHRLDLGYGFLLVTVWDQNRLWVSH